MLCPHAYGTDRSSATRRSGVRGADRMEVGRRQGRHALQRPTRPRRAANRNLYGLPIRHRVGPTGLEHILGCQAYAVATDRSSRRELSQSGNLEAERPGDDRELRRCRRCSNSVRTGSEARALDPALPRQHAGSGLSADGAELQFTERPARDSHPRGRDSRRARHSSSSVPPSYVHRPSGIGCAASGGPHIEATSPASESLSVYFFCEGVERRAAAVDARFRCLKSDLTREVRCAMHRRRANG